MKLIIIIFNIYKRILRYYLIKINRCDRVEIDQFNNERWLNKAGQLHRRYGPAYIRHTTSNGIMARMEWYCNGILHRDKGPAVIIGGITDCYTLEWWVNGKRHRMGAPAVLIVSNYDYGNKKKSKESKFTFHNEESKFAYHEEYFVNGLRHRCNGPAWHTSFVHEWWNEGIVLKELSTFKETMTATFNTYPPLDLLKEMYGMSVNELTKFYCIGKS